MKEQTNWYWTSDLRIVSNVAQSNGISEVFECNDVAYLEAEKERLEIKRQEWVDGARKATNTIRAVYFEELDFLWREGENRRSAYNYNYIITSPR